jgi:Zn-dependent protease with chaperone function
MKKTITSSALAIFAALAIVSCTKTDHSQVNKNELSAAEVSMIQAAGLKATGAIKLDDRYLVEGDILLTADELRSMSTDNGRELIVANTEQYRTTNLVTGLPRTIKIRYFGTHQGVWLALAYAVARYNAQGLLIKFQIINSGWPNIFVTDVSGQPYIASSGFPSNGNPYIFIKFNTAYANWTTNTLTTVLAHEMGHCIGFRHTDYMNRSYSCGGSAYNEGSAGVGAIHIPGTPTGPDPNSWMLACISNGVNRYFNANDKIALSYLY